MALSTHARIEIAIAGALLLGSCNDDRPFTKADYERLDEASNNSEDALNQANDLEDRVSALEEKLGVQ